MRLGLATGGTVASFAGCPPISRTGGAAVAVSCSACSPRLIHSVAPVQGLLVAGCPTAITRRVWAIIVDSLNRVAQRWALPHIGKEVSKTILRSSVATSKAPTFAHRNAAASVILINAGFRVIATAFNARPYAPLRDLFRRTVIFVLPGLSVLTAGLGEAAANISREHFFFYAATTATQPAAIADVLNKSPVAKLKHYKTQTTQNAGKIQ